MTTMLRAAIMLAVLVGLPTAWMYYGPLPPQAQRTVDRLVASAKEMLDWDRIVDGDENSTLATTVSESEIGLAATAPNPASPLQRAGAPEGAQAHPPAEAGSPSAELELARRLEPLLAKLRELGVAAYALEPWGGDRKLFRFHCEMPLAGSDAITQQFEAIAADPQQSVAQVVADVTNWHASRSVATLR
jgi:hypothetical protein